MGRLDQEDEYPKACLIRLRDDEAEVGEILQEADEVPEVLYKVDEAVAVMRRVVRANLESFSSRDGSSAGFVRY